MNWHHLVNPFYQAGILFIKKNALQLAASSAFYVILTVIPFLLLLTRLIGFFIGDIDQVHQLIFTLGQEAFPQVEAGVLLKVKSIVKGPLFGKDSFTFVNFLILSLSSISFFNSIWSGLYAISEDKSLISWRKHLKVLVLMAVTVFLILVLFSLQPIFNFFLKLTQNNILTNSIYQNVISLRAFIDTLRSLNWSFIFLFKNTWFQAGLFFVYIAFVYRWFFNWRLKTRDAFLASGTFVFLLILGKFLFGLYIFNLRSKLIESYGDYYTILVGALWVYFMMAFFYFGVSLCVSRLKQAEVIDHSGLESLSEDRG
ncbi:MAG: YihY/virulence factor BrkB family protein [Bacteriovoracaceae bacterium]|nr:YihY/virulence factor BrkB family protein [Bacteriovoracaceae bacterium]